MARVKKNDNQDLPEPAKEKPWTPDDWFKDEVDTKEEVKKISSLITSLVIHVSLTKSAVKHDNDFPGLTDIREEAQQAREKAVRIMKELLKSWDA